MTQDTLETPGTAIMPMDVRHRVEHAIARIEPETDLAEVQEAIVLLDAISQWVKERKEELNVRLIPYISRNGGFSIGPERFYLGETLPDLKCVSIPKTLEALARASEVIDKETGEAVVDWKQVCTFFSTNAFKPATTEKFLAQKKMPGEFFVRPPAKAKVVREGEEKPEVKRINTDFVK